MMITLEEYLNINYPQIYHLTITGRCNAFCEGCINSLIYGRRDSFLKEWESDPERDLKIISYLLNFTNGNPVYLAFYGGEPLLSFKKIKHITENICKNCENKNLKFIIYTNGMLLDRILSEDKEFFKKIDLLMVSIDGRDKQHNLFRKGTKLNKIERNLEILKKEITISVLMWSTLRENMSLEDCFYEFSKLFNQGLVDYFYWHLVEKNEPIRKFEKFKSSYLSELKVLFQEFLSFLKKGKILPLLPICELVYFLAKGIKRGHTACGIEKIRNFDILGGKILPCVDLGDKFILGETTSEGLIQFDKIKIQNNLKELVEYKQYLGCESCEAEFYCGGRCPVLVRISLERAKQYCELTRGFVKLGQQFLPEVLIAINESKIDLSQIYYPYGYLVLLTDVIP